MKFFTIKNILMMLLTFISVTLITLNADANELKVSNNEKILIYYFHGNMRCVTCRKIEELTEEAVKNTFGDNYNKNNVIYKAINVEEDGNEHYIADYQLMVKCVIIAKEENGKETGWERLDKVWSYYSDKEQFFNYFTDNAKKLLAEK